MLDDFRKKPVDVTPARVYIEYVRTQIMQTTIVNNRNWLCDDRNSRSAGGGLF